MNATDTSQIVPFQLRSIYIKDSMTKLSPGFSPVIPDQTMAAHFRMMPSDVYDVTGPTQPSPDEVTSVAFTTRFEFIYTRNLNVEITPETFQDSDICARITADISVDYALVSSEMPVPEALQAWSMTAALTQSWPYWREFCHSAMSRMGLPVSIMPLLSLSNSPDPAKPPPLAKPKVTRKRTAKST